MQELAKTLDGCETKEQLKEYREKLWGKDLADFFEKMRNKSAFTLPH